MQSLKLHIYYVFPLKTHVALKTQDSVTLLETSGDSAILCMDDM